MRILHFSDIHLSTPSFEFSCLFDKRILGLSNYYLNRRLKHKRSFVTRIVAAVEKLAPDVIICSGDISSIGAPKEFSEAVVILEPLIQNKDRPFLFVPGNHDNYVNRKPTQDALQWAFEHLNQDKGTFGELPWEYRLGQHRFWLLDETQPTNIFLSSGTINASTKDWLQARLAEPRESGEKRYLVGHFPARREGDIPLARRRKLAGNEVIEEALEAGTLDMSLCGHIHNPFCRYKRSGSMEICAGSLPLMGYVNLLDISSDENRWQQQWYNLNNMN